MGRHKGSLAKKNKDIALAVIRTKTNKILIVERVGYERAQEGNVLSWGFAGGVVENGINPKELLGRRVLAETGVTVKVGKLISETTDAFSHVHLHLSYYSCTLVPGSVQPSQSLHEIARVKWIACKDLKRFFTSIDPGVAKFLRIKVF